MLRPARRDSRDGTGILCSRSMELLLYTGLVPPLAPATDAQIYQIGGRTPRKRPSAKRVTQLLVLRHNAFGFVDRDLAAAVPGSEYSAEQHSVHARKQMQEAVLRPGSTAERQATAPPTMPDINPGTITRHDGNSPIA